MSKENRSKVKVCKWLDTPERKENQQYRDRLACIPEENQMYFRRDVRSETRKDDHVFFLNIFINPYDTEQDFYPQFYARLGPELRR